ncbi:hypothetical protein VU10_07595, partial [Desulfobulbus sp. US1]|nr:hypothetical protein [Desulfobulbus sp. US1]
LEGVDAIDLSQLGLINTMKGKFLEMVAEVSLLKFNHERLPGAWFGKIEEAEEIEVPLFQYVRTQTVKAAASPAYQIDVLGKEQNNNRVWLCECKYTRAALGLAQVEKLENAARASAEK